MQTSRIRWHIKSEIYFFGAVVFLIIPLRWIAAWLIAAVAHELFHYAALRLCGVNVDEVTIGMHGATMRTESMEPSTETICALAGPLGGLCLLFLSRWAPYIAICGLFQSLYNLLPIFPLDGGRALLGILRCVLSADSADRIYSIIKVSVLLIFLIMSVVCLYFRLGLIPLIFTVILFLKSKKENPLENGINKL